MCSKMRARSELKQIGKNPSVTLFELFNILGFERHV